MPSMSWGFHKRKLDMGSGRELACFCLLLLLLLENNNPCFADDSSRFIRGKLASSSTLNPARIDHNRHKGVVGPHKQVGDDEVFGAEKRRVYTGPNPLHNR